MRTPAEAFRLAAELEQIPQGRYNRSAVEEIPAAGGQ